MKLKKFVANTIKSWYLYLIVFAALEIINYGVLGIFMPEKICFWVSSVLIVLLCIYLYFLFSCIYDNIAGCMRGRKEELYSTIDSLKNHIDKLDDENKQLSKDLTNTLRDDIKTGNNETVNAIHVDIESNKECIVDAIEESNSQIKETVLEKTGLLLDKSEMLMKNQTKNVEKVLDDFKYGISEITELVKTKFDLSSEQGRERLSTLLKTLQNQVRETAQDMISKIEEGTNKTQECINDQHRVVEEKADINRADILAAIETAEIKISTSIDEGNKSIQMVDKKAENNLRMNAENNRELNEKTILAVKGAYDGIARMVTSLEEKSTIEHSERMKKADSIIEISNTIMKNQEFIDEKTQNKLSQIEESGTMHIDKMTETVMKNIEESSAKEVSAITDASEKINDRVRDIAKEQTLQIERIEQIIEIKSNKIISETSNEIDKSIKGFAEGINLQLEEFKEVFDRSSIKVENKLAELHSDTTRMINLVLDNVDDGIEKNERYINLINIQLAEITKNNKVGISDVLQEIEQSKRQIEVIVEKLEEFSELHQTQTDKTNREYIQRLTEYYSSCVNKLNNVQLEISSLSQMTVVLNNVYSLLKDDPRTETSKSKDPSRIEEYKDPESGTTVKNYYKHGALSSSEMVSDGRKTYDVLYDKNGKITRSRNYNQKGEIVTELEFYENGQVKKRTEIVMKNGSKKTITSKFDDKGNKIK